VGSRLEWAGGDLYVNRRLWLEQFALGHFDLDRDIVQEVPFSRTWNEPTYRDYVDCGGEGVVLKNPNARYVIGKRPANNWYKVKKFQTLDVVITGFTDGQGKYEGQIGAIIFKDPTGRVGRCSGMDDATRLGLSAAVHSEIVGSVIEIRHWGHSGQGEEGYRFPQFVRFRPDKGVS
jgi:ATP-dependent DNA ligase